MRRAVLALVVLAGALAPARGTGAAPARPAHLVLVIVGGGVRAADLLDAGRMPALAALAASGTALGDLESGAPSPYAAALRILCGADEAPEPGAKPRPRRPTLMERVREAKGLPASKVWFVSAADGDDLHLAYGRDPAHGRPHAPSAAYGAGAFAEPLRRFLEAHGRPLPLGEASRALLARLRAMGRESVGAWLPPEVDAGTPEAERVERALLEEIDRRSALVRGPAPEDERALRSALSVLRVHRPALTVVRLLGAEVARASLPDYFEVLAQADRGIERLRAAAAADPALAGRTAFVVVGDVGRAALDPGASGGGRRGSGAGVVSLVAAGPGIRKGGRVRGPRRLEDVAPTLARLLDLEMASAEGRVLDGLLAP